METKETTWDEPKEGYVTDEVAARFEALRATKKNGVGGGNETNLSKSTERKAKIKFQNRIVTKLMSEITREKVSTLWTDFVTQPEFMRLVETNARSFFVTAVSSYGQLLEELKTKTEEIPSLVNHPFYQFIKPKFHVFKKSIAEELAVLKARVLELMKDAQT